jgi:5-methylcytosine-specific restriction protein A
LYDNELDLPFDQIYCAQDTIGVNSSIEQPDTFDTPNGPQIRKRPWVSKNALRVAGFLCEFNPEHKTFMTDKGLRFMEAHHLIRCTVKLHDEFWERFKRSIDTESNIVSLCPTCHRRIHYGNREEKTEMIEFLFDKRRKTLHKAGIQISLDELMSVYSL